MSEPRSSRPTPGCPRDRQDGETDGALLLQVHQRRNPDAMTALMRRHGPLVFGVCLRTLRDHHHAEDAFQETFHVLFRKAGLIARPELLAAWLYGVAHRIAVRARQRLHRRSSQELQADIEGRSPPPSCDGDLRALLDEELQRLPEHYRVPLVLCFLQGYSNEEAAQFLGLPKGTIQSRIARGRGRLRKRLQQRGVLFSPVALGVALLELKASGELPPQLILDALGRFSPRLKVGPSAGGNLMASRAVLACAIAAALVGGLTAVLASSQIPGTSTEAPVLPVAVRARGADSSVEEVPPPAKEPTITPNQEASTDRSQGFLFTWTKTASQSVRWESGTGASFQGQFQSQMSMQGSATFSGSSRSPLP